MYRYRGNVIALDGDLVSVQFDGYDEAQVCGVSEVAPIRRAGEADTGAGSAASDDDRDGSLGAGDAGQEAVGAHFVGDWASREGVSCDCDTNRFGQLVGRFISLVGFDGASKQDWIQNR